METADQLHTRIATARQRLQQEKDKKEQLLQEVEQARQRQLLREELEGVEDEIRVAQNENSYHEAFRAAVDDDEADADDHVPHGPTASVFGPATAAVADTRNKDCYGGDALDFGRDVVKGEYEWRIHNMSWVLSGLRQDRRRFCFTGEFKVGDATFDLVYNPMTVTLGAGPNGGQRCGSLAIRHRRSGGVTFRSRFLIRGVNGDFSQWGETCNECHPLWDVTNKVFGPDVQDVSGGTAIRLAGIFGLSHAQLLQSDWVQDDVLTVKVQLEVRRDVDVLDTREAIKPLVVVPADALRENLSSLFESGKHSDVTFVIDGEFIKAHSQILCARSEFFDTELTCGLRESVSKEVVVNDCDSSIFRLLLKYLYTDDLACIDEALRIASRTASSSTLEDHPEVSSGTDACSGKGRIGLLQRLLAASHKYQASRLQCWCEQQLCEHISVKEVCSVLCQAHLYDAKQLEKVCLTFIKDNMESVVATHAFGSLTQDWPEVMLKVSIHTAGISESCAALAIKGQQESKAKKPMEASGEDGDSGGKRQRCE